MKENLDNAMEWVKSQKDIKGCITGSYLLDYFPDENQDLDVFLYNEKSFTEIFYAMHHDPMFTILDPLEKWKADKFRLQDSDFYKFGLITIKFTYNTCVPVNIILKKKGKDIFSVLSSFDLDIVARGYDIASGKILDLSENPGTKIATWNRWNTAFYSNEVWEISRVLRQLERCFKYYRRGYDTDSVILKYMELIDRIQEFDNIFNSNNYTENLKIKKDNTKIVRQICEVWLKDHSITDEEIELLKIKIKEI
jgi:hypothetical protein